MIGNLYDGVVHKKLIGNTAAGKDGSAVASNAIATAGFDRVRVCIELGAVVDEATFTASISACDTSTGSFEDVVLFADENDPTDPVVITGKSDTTLILDCALGLGREFIKVNYQRTTQNIELDGIYLDFYGVRVIPVTQDSTILDEVVDFVPEAAEEEAADGDDT